MPIHLEDREIAAEVGGHRSALIVPCNLCPAVTAAVRTGQPFLRLFGGWLGSTPFAQELRALQGRLRAAGVEAEIFNSRFPHQWFLCMWTPGQCRRLRRVAPRYEVVIVLGCPSATETVRRLVAPAGCKVIEGMRVTGIMNAKARVGWPPNLSFEDCRIVPLSGERHAQ